MEDSLSSGVCLGFSRVGLGLVVLEMMAVDYDGVFFTLKFLETDYLWYHFFVNFLYCKNLEAFRYVTSCNIVLFCLSAVVAVYTM